MRVEPYNSLFLDTLITPQTKMPMNKRLENVKEDFILELPSY